MKIGKEREEELFQEAVQHLAFYQYELWGYHHWDALIECDEALTAEELEWLENNYEIVITLQKKGEA